MHNVDEIVNTYYSEHGRRGGYSKFARDMKVSRTTIYCWRDSGRIPDGRQEQLARVLDGKRIVNEGKGFSNVETLRHLQSLENVANSVDEVKKSTIFDAAKYLAALDGELVKLKSERTIVASFLSGGIS